MSIFDHYKSWVFDFDGVILDSNKIKTDAFYKAVVHYGEDQAKQLCAYHVAHGGISRFVKFNYFFETILGRSPLDGEIDQALDRFAEAVRQGLLECAQAPLLEDLFTNHLKDLPCTVISGSMQEELREIMKLRGLDHYFDHIYGSPDSKDVIFEREIANKSIKKPAVYIGDSLYDYEMAHKFGLDFIFAYNWTEFSDWQTFFADKPVWIIKDLSELSSIQ
jgi:phosphoglycolate phosphatase-like HAD superfamily hydrolase